MSDNNTLREVNLRYSIAGGEWKSAITARDGVARIYGKVPGESIRVEVDDARWDCPEGAIDTTVGGSPIALRVFPSDSSQMTREERMAAHRLRILTLIEERRQAEAQTELATIEGGTTGTLIPSDTSAAAPQVRAVYQDPLWGFAANRHILAFLEGLRMEASPAVEAGDGTTTYATRIDSRLING